MSRHTKAQLVYEWGLIRTTNGLNIAHMDRNEPGTSPTERDANARRIVQIWNLWADVVDLLQAVANSADIPEMLREDAQHMRKRIRREIGDG